MANHPFDRILEKYAQGFRQRDECTCGPSSLALAAHAIGFKLFAESAWLDKKTKPWMPVEEFVSRGMALHEVQFVTQFIFGSKIEILLNRAFPENKNLFHDDLLSAKKGNLSIVINFAQDHLLGSTDDDQGHPHYSLVAGFDEKKKNILIADVDPDIPNPYESSFDQVFESMEIENPILQTPRGWLTLRKRR